MLTEKIEALEKVVAGGKRELSIELESLKQIASGMAQGRIDVQLLEALSMENFAAVVSELAAVKNAGLLSEILAASLAKPCQKFLKKTIHRLKSEGVAFPEKVENKTATVSAQVISEWAVVTPAMLMNGQQLAYYFITGSMGSSFLIIHLDPELGILDFKELQISESRARRVASHSAISKEISMPVITVPKEHWAWLVGTARNLTKAGPFLPEADKVLRKLSIPLEEAKLPHPALKGFALSPDQVAAGVRASDRLFDHPWFKNWMFDEETVRICGEELDQVSHSPLQLSEGQLVERLENIFTKHTKSGMIKNRVRILQGLFENSWLLKLGGEPELAEIAFALGQIASREDAPPEFFRKVLIRTFPEAWKKLEAKPSSLIISS